MELIEEIKAGNIKKIRTLAEDREKFGQDIKYLDSNGMSSLHYACKYGYLPVVRLILCAENGLDLLNQRDNLGLTPLMSAIYSQDDGGPEIVATLLAQGADPNVKDNEGNTALHHAAGYGAGDTIEFVAKNKKVNLDIQNDKGETPSHWAIKESQMWAFQTLLKEGAKIDFKTADGETLAHYAVRSIGNAPQFLRVLSSKGLDLNIQDKSGKSVMKIAKEKNLGRAINTLIELGITEEKAIAPTSQTIQPKKIKNKSESVKNRLEDKLKLAIYIILILLLPVVFAAIYKVMMQNKSK